ncbi:MAG: heparinase II/III-family protein [Micrococcales bacterium]|nr:heparinase II/III-family protein [Micrococcales bacterium]MCL2667637.1 heparinase II/III-family protein [Micrococcales bacterium]
MLSSDVCKRATAIAAVEPSRFFRQEDDAERAARILEGWVEIAPHNPVLLDYDSFEAKGCIDDNWRSLFASMAWSDAVRREAISGDQAACRGYTNLLRRILCLCDSDKLGISSVYWKDHPTGVRAAALVAAVSFLGVPEWLQFELERIGDHLFQRDHYKGWGNHCLMQNSGLLGIGILLARDDYIATAHARGFRLLKCSVAADGSSTEGSIAYHARLHRWWYEFRQKLQLVDIPLEREWGRISLMQRFLDYATLHDGTICGFGDTALGEVQPPVVDPDAPRRSADIAAFSAGYLFARSSSTVRQQTYLAARFGQSFAAAPHGHEDAGTVEWAVGSHRLLTDSGMYGYTQSPWRTWVKKMNAHNIVTVPSRGYDQDATSTLVRWERSCGHLIATFDLGTIPRCQWSRTIIFPLKSAYLLVVDEVKVDEEEQIVQRWNVPDDGHYEVGEAEVTGHGPSSLRMRWITGEQRLRVVAGWEGNDEYPWVSGWRSNEYGSIHPSPAVEAIHVGRSWRPAVLFECIPTSYSSVTVSELFLDDSESSVTFRHERRSTTIVWSHKSETPGCRGLHDG